MATDVSTETRFVTIDGFGAAAHVAYKANEVMAIYPITPSSDMAELADQWSAQGRPNIWGAVPTVQEMQAESGAAGAIHGALQGGALATTFTASQGLLLMIPNMYKIAGELTSTVFHVAARTVATHALSIFGDHSDVMAVRSTGWAMLFSNSVQEVMDFALIAQMATLEARVPFLHAFDGFRTSHEIMKIRPLSDDDMRTMIDDDLVRKHRSRRLSPDNPFIRGTAQNPDVFFQMREAINPYYLAVPQIVQGAMDKFADRTGRQYRLFDYIGAPDAERVVVLMGSGAETAEETIELMAARGEKVGAIKVRLFRPFSVADFVAAIPETARTVAVLDRTKEPGAIGEPLYQDVVTAIAEGMMGNGRHMPKVIGGRYGLSSKEFTPAMVKGVFDEMLDEQPRNHFTVGINDDVTHTSIPFDPEFRIDPDDEVRAVFWGLGADGTVSANKNSIKIIGEETPAYAQGYFVYDSRKAGARTISHLRFGPRPIHSPHLIQKASFVGVHQFGFLNKYDILSVAEDGATLLINSPFGPDDVWEHLPGPVQEQIIAKGLGVYVVDGYRVGRETGMGARINTIMQTCFFTISGVLPKDEAIARIKDAIQKTYGKRGQFVVQRNFAAVDAALSHMHKVEIPDVVSNARQLRLAVPADAPDFVQNVTGEILAGNGDLLPVSAFPPDGTFPSGTSQWERSNIGLEVPVWEPDLCIQCGKCVLVCPHAVIRAKVVDDEQLADAPDGFEASPARWRELKGQKYTLQVAVEDCTGCTLCVDICPVKDKSQVSRKALNMQPLEPIKEKGIVDWDFFKKLDDFPRSDGIAFNNVKNTQLLEPLFEFSGACSGCGETPYLSLLTRLFGDRMVVANATGCSSIYGGNLPTTPWATNKDGRGPAWSNSLFEDNAEFGLGMLLANENQQRFAEQLLRSLRDELGPELADAILEADQSSEAGIDQQRGRVAELKSALSSLGSPEAHDLIAVSDALVKKTIWIVGGDGWAYDIGYGGLDHVLASGKNVNVLVMDTEVYSNTGGQASKATPMAAVAKFAAGGKALGKKDLGMIAMTYGHVYVAQIAMGGSDTQTIRAIQEAEAYDGPSLIIAYSQCIAHGIDMAKGMQQQKLAVDSGYWPLYRYNPALRGTGENPLHIDSRPPKIPLKDYAYNETRYRMLAMSDPVVASKLMKAAQEEVERRWKKYSELAEKEA